MSVTFATNPLLIKYCILNQGFVDKMFQEVEMNVPHSCKMINQIILDIEFNIGYTEVR